MMKINLRERFRVLSYTYAAVTFGLVASLLLYSLHWNTLNFWLTAILSYTIVTGFDLFVLSVLNDVEIVPSHFLFRVMVLVVGIQVAFAVIYHFAANETTFLMKEGRRVTDFVDAMYFSGATLFTVGYGDIVPHGDFRFTSVAEVYGGTLFIFAFFTWGLSVIAGHHFRSEKAKR